MFIFTLILTMILSGAEVDLFVPSFPELQQVFELSPFMVELTLSVNLAAHCITALITGNLGDKYGRKPVIIVGLIIFILGSILCVFAPNYSTLILGRLLQGVGIAAPSVLSYVVLADLYSTKKLQVLAGYTNASITIGMAVSPVIGSYINLYFNWQGNFIVLLILGVICLSLIILFVPDTGRHNANIKISLKEYIPVLKSKKTLLYLISLGFAMQCYWVFIGMSPILYMEDLNVSLIEFGLYQGVIAATFGTVSLLSGYLITRHGQAKCFVMASVIIAIYFILTLIIIIFNIKDPVFITFSMLFQAIGMVFPINILWPLALNSFENARGRINALLVFFRLSLSAIFLEMAGYFYNGTYFMIGIIICVTLIISALSFLVLRKEEMELFT